MLRAPLLLARAPEPAYGARDSAGDGAHAAYCRPDRRHAGQGAGEQTQRDAESASPVTGVTKSRFGTATHAVPVVRGSPVRPQPTRRTWPGTWPAGTGCAMHCAAPTPSPGQIRRRHDRPPAPAD